MFEYNSDTYKTWQTQSWSYWRQSCWNSSQQALWLASCPSPLWFLHWRDVSKQKQTLMWKCKEHWETLLQDKFMWDHWDLSLTHVHHYCMLFFWYLCVLSSLHTLLPALPWVGNCYLAPMHSWWLELFAPLLNRDILESLKVSFYLISLVMNIPLLFHLGSSGKNVLGSPKSPHLQAFCTSHCLSGLGFSQWEHQCPWCENTQKLVHSWFH